MFDDKAYYYIIAKHSNLYITLNKADKHEGRGISQNVFQNADIQKWKFKKSSTGYYYIINKYSGLCLDVDNNSKDNGKHINQRSLKHTDHQRWKIEQLKDGSFNLIVRHSKKALDVAGKKKKPCTALIQWDYWKGDNQHFWIVKVLSFDEKAEYQICSKKSGLFLAVSSADKHEGRGVVQQTNNKSDNQIWKLKMASDGFYYIIAKHSGMCLDVDSGSSSNGKNVNQRTISHKDHQKWKIEQLPDGYYKIIAKHSDKALDVDGGSKNSGTKVIQWDFHGGDNQRWAINIFKNTNDLKDIKQRILIDGSNVTRWPNRKKSSLQQLAKAILKCKKLNLEPEVYIDATERYLIDKKMELEQYISSLKIIQVPKGTKSDDWIIAEVTKNNFNNIYILTNDDMAKDNKIPQKAFYSCQAKFIFNNSGEIMINIGDKIF